MFTGSAMLGVGVSRSESACPFLLWYLKSKFDIGFLIITTIMDACGSVTRVSSEWDYVGLIPEGGFKY